jgi:hypothetical protein
MTEGGSAQCALTEYYQIATETVTIEFHQISIEIVGVDAETVNAMTTMI